MEVYEAPALRRFGSVAALTASSVKCSIGTDAAFGDAGRNAGASYTSILYHLPQSVICRIPCESSSGIRGPFSRSWQAKTICLSRQFRGLTTRKVTSSWQPP